MRQDRKNAEALGTHMVHRMQEPTSSSIMRFCQPVSKKIALEIKPAFKYHVKHSITKLQSTKFVSSSPSEVPLCSCLMVSKNEREEISTNGSC